MPKFIWRILSCLLVFKLSALSLLSAQASPQPQQGKIRLLASASSERRGIFYLDYLLPLAYSKDNNTLLFFNPRESLSVPLAEETNLGLGLRHAFSDKFILGTHFFFDRKLAHSKKLYSQVGVGLEFLSQPFDFRFNYYDPTTKPKVVDDSYELGSNTLVNVRSIEEPLGGYDFEVGFPVLPSKLATRLYLGGFFFNSNLGKDSNGYRIRSETNLTNWFVLDMTLNSRNSGEQEFVAGIRITIPIEPGRILNRQDPFKTKPQDSYIKDRLLERVVRDVDVQSSASSKKEDVPGISMIYVDNSKPAGGNGSLEYPYNTLQGALDAVGVGTGKRIYVFKGDGTNTGYKRAAGFTLVDDLVLWGSGYDGGYKGLPAIGYPMIDADNSAVNSVINLANNNIVMGLDLQHGSSGIYGLNKTGCSILHNNIANNSDQGIYVYNNSANTFSDFTFTGNTITGNNENGVFVYNTAAGTFSHFTFTDNTIAGNGNVSASGIYVENTAAGTISDFTFTGNHITGHVPIVINSYDICVYNPGTGTISGFTFIDNVLNNNINGIYVRNEVAGTVFDFTFTRNTATGNNSRGMLAYNVGVGSISDFTFTDNDIYDNNQGIYVLNNSSGAFSDFTFTGNTVTGSVLFGIYLRNVAAGTFSDCTFTRNTVTGNTQNGINLNKGTGSISGINLGDGTVGGNNSLYDNGDGVTYFDFNNGSGIVDLPAQYNWWGQDANPSSQISGSVIYDPWLHSAP